MWRWEGFSRLTLNCKRQNHFFLLKGDISRHLLIISSEREREIMSHEDFHTEKNHWRKDRVVFPLKGKVSRTKSQCVSRLQSGEAEIATILLMADSLRIQLRLCYRWSCCSLDTSPWLSLGQKFLIQVCKLLFFLKMPFFLLRMVSHQFLAWIVFCKNSLSLLRCVVLKF